MAEFSAYRAFGHIEVIARAPHPIGTAENARVREYLINTLSAMGLSPVTQTVEVEDYFGAPGNTVDVVNIMTEIEGVDSTGAVVLMAHYDTVPATPGANDDSGAVASLLEVARVLVAGPPTRNDVILLFTDGEEPAPRFGSSAFVDQHPWFGDVAYVVNLEAIGSAGPSLLIETSGSERLMIDLFAGAAPHPAAFSFITEIAELAGGFGTDFDSFVDEGIPGMSFAYSHGSPIYHTVGDSVSNVSLASLQQQGTNTLALVRTVGDTRLEITGNHEGSVFFTVVGSHIVRYPDSVALVISLVATAIWAVAAFRHQRRGVASIGSTARSAGLVLTLFVVAIAGFALIWTVTARLRPSPGVTEAYWYLVLLAAIGIGVWLAAYRFLNRRVGGPNVLGGIVLVWLVLGVAASTLAPGTSYLFVWPALAGAVYWLANPKSEASALPGVFVVAACVLIVNLPAIDIFYQMAQPRPGNPDSELIPVAGLALGLWVLTVALIHTITRNAAQATRG